MTMRSVHWPVAVLGPVAVLAAILHVTAPAFAQAPLSQKAPAVKPATSKPAANPAAVRPPVPPAEKLVLLVRLSLLTLNDALLSGNYTVLRDRAGPSFSRNNTAAQLARIFAKLEEQKLDLSAVATLSPTLTAAEVAGTPPILHIAGFFPGEPMQLSFDVSFEPADGHWRLFGIAVAQTPANSSGVAAGKPSVPPPSKAPNAK